MDVVPRFLWDARLVDLIEEAFERIQVSPSVITGEQLHSALRSLRLQLIEWSGYLNKTWAVEEQQFALTAEQSTITLPVGALAVAEAYYRDTASQTDTRMFLMSRDSWTMIPDKSIVGARPTHLWIDKKHNVGGARQYTGYLWQRPQFAGTLIANLIMSVQDPGGVGEAPEIPQTWFDALAAALARRLARKFRPDSVPILRAEQQEAYDTAVGSTAERTDIEFVFPSRRRNG